VKKCKKQLRNCAIEKLRCHSESAENGRKISPFSSGKEILHFAVAVFRPVLSAEHLMAERSEGMTVVASFQHSVT